jgi:magnesium-transporting ATPase (P-type)
VSVSQETTTQAATQPGWHASDAPAVAKELGVEPERGLGLEEARLRLQSQGPNRLAGARKESGFRAFLRQYRDVMQLILLAAAVISLLVTGDVVLMEAGNRVPADGSIGIGLAASLVVVEELIKLVIRQRGRRRVAAATRPSMSGA